MRILMLGVVMATFASAASAQGSSPTASAAAISKDWKPGQVFRVARTLD
jgi:hypothetical protein